MQTTRKYLPRTIRPDYLIKHPFSALLNLVLNWDGHRSVATDTIQGCARFREFLQNFSERQILWRMCSVVFHALTLKLPIQTSLSVAPELPVSLSSHEKCLNFRKTSTPQWTMQTTRKYSPWTIRPDYLIKHPFSALLNLVLNWDGHRSVATDSQMTGTIRF